MLSKNIQNEGTNRVGQGLLVLWIPHDLQSFNRGKLTSSVPLSIGGIEMYQYIFVYQYILQD
jgi:hypothetical protein